MRARSAHRRRDRCARSPRAQGDGVQGDDARAWRQARVPEARCRVRQRICRGSRARSGLISAQTPPARDFARAVARRIRLVMMVRHLEYCQPGSCVRRFRPADDLLPTICFSRFAGRRVPVTDPDRTYPPRQASTRRPVAGLPASGCRTEAAAETSGRSRAAIPRVRDPDQCAAQPRAAGSGRSRGPGDNLWSRPRRAVRRTGPESAHRAVQSDRFAQEFMHERAGRLRRTACPARPPARCGRHAAQRRDPPSPSPRPGRG